MVTSVSTTSTVASSSATATRSAPAKSSVVGKLGGGSGIDINALANSLVDAERVPRKIAIDKSIGKNEAVIAGFSAVKYALGNLQTAFDNLKDKSDFKNISISNSQPSAYTVSATSSSDTGSHTVLITQLATAQRSTGTQIYATANDSIPGLTSLTLGGTGFPTVNGTAPTIAVTTATPAGVVDAINSAGKGLSAQLVNTGAGYKVVVTSAAGQSRGFMLSSNATTPDDAATGLNFSTTLQNATNAALTVDGIAITSDSNTVTGAIAGVSLSLLATNNGSPASLNLVNDTSGAKAKVLALVTAYNDANSLLGEVSNPKSTLETYGATLAGNSSVRAIRDQIRAMVTDDSSTKASSGGLSALRDIGIAVDKNGKLTTDTVTLDLALNFNLSNTVTLLSGNQENQSSFDTGTAGIAGDASKKLTALMSSSGTLSTESANANSRISKYQDNLIALEDRMARLLERYTKQFAAMDSFVGQSKNTQTGLTSTFQGLMAMYTK